MPKRHASLERAASSPLESIVCADEWKQRVDPFGRRRRLAGGRGRLAGGVGTGARGRRARPRLLEAHRKVDVERLERVGVMPSRSLGGSRGGRS